MPDGRQLLVALHVAANLLWIGGIVAAGVVIARRDVDPRARGVLGRAVYSRVAAPAFLVSVLCGALLLALDPRFYFVQTRFMHAKLMLAAAVIALHHVIAAGARRLANGRATSAPSATTLTVALAACAVATTFLALLKPF